MKRVLKLLLTTCTLAVIGCAQPPVPEIPGGNGTNNGTGTRLGDGPCSIKTPDADGDGLSDECEKLLGTNPNDKDTNKNGVPDPKDCPPADPLCKSVPKDFQNAALQDLAKGLLLGSGGMTGIPSPGTTTTISEYEIRLSTGIAALPAEKEMCGTASSYLYLLIAGTINTCKLLPSTCGQGNQPTRLELCADLSGKTGASKENLEALIAEGSTLSLENLQWTKGSADGFAFAPAILNSDSTSGTFKVGFTPTKVGNVSGCVVKINSVWESSLTVVGQVNDGTGSLANIEVKTPKINKKWERTSGFSCDLKPDKTQFKGIVGPWKVDTFL